MSKDTSKSVGSNNNDSSIVFKLFRDLESEELERASRVNILFMIVFFIKINNFIILFNQVSDLNVRISNLEKVFGAGNSSFDERQINILCSNLENKSIMVSYFLCFLFLNNIKILKKKGLVESLNTKINLIDSQTLEQIESRLQMISQRVSQLNDKKNLIEDQEKLNRVNELYTMISKWKDVSATVPAIVERLTALNDLHQKGNFFF